MLLNREELAKRIAYEGGYNIGDIKQVLSILEDIIEDGLKNGDTIKIGKLLKLYLVDVPEKRAYNGLDKEYFIRPAKRVPKAHLLSGLTNIELPPKEEE